MHGLALLIHVTDPLDATTLSVEESCEINLALFNNL
jgi:hypothetical protein